MDTKPSIVANEQENTHRGHSRCRDVPDLIFSFDNDLELERDTLDINNPYQSYDDTSLRSASPPSSTWQSGYVMISPFPRHSAADVIPTTQPPNASSTWSRITDGDVRSLSPSAAPFPLPPANIGQTVVSYPQSTSYSSNPRNPREWDQNQQQQQQRRTPEPPTTPRTRQFNASMLSLLSLLPPGRYLSPSPSVYEDAQFEEAQFEEEEEEMDAVGGEHGDYRDPVPAAPTACAIVPSAFPTVHAAAAAVAVESPPGRRYLESPPSSVTAAGARSPPMKMAWAAIVSLWAPLTGVKRVW
ncbi:hypothetical protein SAMD00023353_1800950 [Rosellinia necatrix]|uniref:Uncharacterized protein n=1 Tax=Rosellinia necatrix TaxID=77044 RepID=A0A1W2TE82_ROSNE|nr:hypothetical protein SAMD00023353_1800950 [Rosellinia necatrix]